MQLLTKLKKKTITSGFRTTLKFQELSPLIAIINYLQLCILTLCELLINYYLITAN